MFETDLWQHSASGTKVKDCFFVECVAFFFNSNGVINSIIISNNVISVIVSVDIIDLIRNVIRFAVYKNGVLKARRLARTFLGGHGVKLKYVKFKYLRSARSL